MERYIHPIRITLVTHPKIPKRTLIDSHRLAVVIFAR